HRAGPMSQPRASGSRHKSVVPSASLAAAVRAEPRAFLERVQVVGDEVFEADLLALADWNFSLAPLDGGLPDTKFSDVLVGVVIDVENDAVVTQAQVDAFHINSNFHAEIVQRPVRAGRAIGRLRHADVPGP